MIPWKRRRGRAAHRSWKKHQYRLWVQAGRPMRRGNGQVLFSPSVYRDLLRAVQDGTIVCGTLLDDQIARRILYPPIAYVRPRHL